MKKMVLGLTAAVVVSVVLLFLYLWRPTSGEVKPTEVRPETGYLAPDFTLRDLEGKEVKLSESRGQVVLVNFWASWCPPCRAEIPEIEAYYQKNGQKVVILGVDLQEDPARVKSFARTMNMHYPILLDSGQVAKQYRVRVIPTTFVVSPRGVISDVFTGPMSYSQIEKMVLKASLLK
ncbi:MAG: TlpA family protein disulfide reductase [Firmicutes bacterium]|nr:TlpA family protein disulfide reductase [Bacillota bacterium]MCL5040311.1 TlpA family protein disulfide reductase [Bacillota bacterium]